VDSYSEIPLASLIEKASAGDWRTADYLRKSYRWESFWVGSEMYRRHPEVKHPNEAEDEKWEREYVRLLEVAAEGGDKDAMYWLSYECDGDNAFNWTLKAAKAGHALACIGMGLFYSEGDGVSLDLNEAIEWWAKAADLGEDENAFERIAPLALEGHEGAIGWVKAALEGYEDRYLYYLTGAADEGNEVAMELVLEAVDQGNDGAIDWIIRAAREGHEGALRWMKEAADEGHEGAFDWMSEVADQWQYPTHEAAFGWMKEAADRGYEPALQWMKEAAERGREGAIEWIKGANEQ
jgi:hypothetical protein